MDEKNKNLGFYVSKKVLYIVIIIFTFLLLPNSFSAEIEPTEFIMEETPVFIDYKTIDEIKQFYENGNTSDFLSKETNTVVKSSLVVSRKTIEVDALVRTFSITDITYVDPSRIDEFMTTTIEDIFFSLTSSLELKYISTIIYQYGANYHVTINEETGEISEILLHIALYLGDGYDKIDELITEFIHPEIASWEPLSAQHKIYLLNEFMLDGRFKYDIKGNVRKSTYAFISNGIGTCEEYAGLTALFLEEMGLENILISGLAKVNDELIPHVWNLVYIEPYWYHVDILWNAPVDGNGVHGEITNNYLLKSTADIEHDHFMYSNYENYYEQAKYSFDVSIFKFDETEEENPEEEIPEEIIPEEIPPTSHEILKELIDEAYEIIIKRSYDYTYESIQNLESVHATARSVYENEESTDYDLNLQSEFVRLSLDSLVEFTVAEKSKLYSVLSKAYTYLVYDYEQYTFESLDKMVLPYEEAVLVYQNHYATQSEVDAARSKLNSFINALVKIETEEENTETENPETNPPEGNLGIIANLPEPNPGDEISEQEPDPESENKPEPETETPEETEEIDKTEESETEPEKPNETENPENQSNEEEQDEPVANIPENNEIDKPKEMNYDLFIYIFIAVIAFGGMVYLIGGRIRYYIIQKINEIKNDDEIDETEDETEDETKNIFDISEEKITEKEENQDTLTFPMILNEMKQETSEGATEEKKEETEEEKKEETEEEQKEETEEERKEEESEKSIMIEKSAEVISEETTETEKPEKTDAEKSEINEETIESEKSEEEIEIENEAESEEEQYSEEIIEIELSEESEPLNQEKNEENETEAFEENEEINGISDSPKENKSELNEDEKEFDEIIEEPDKDEESFNEIEKSDEIEESFAEIEESDEIEESFAEIEESDEIEESFAEIEESDEDKEILDENAAKEKNNKTISRLLSFFSSKDEKNEDDIK